MRVIHWFQEHILSGSIAPLAIIDCMKSCLVLISSLCVARIDSRLHSMRGCDAVFYRCARVLFTLKRFYNLHMSAAVANAAAAAPAPCCCCCCPRCCCYCCPSSMLLLPPLLPLLPSSLLLIYLCRCNYCPWLFSCSGPIALFCYCCCPWRYPIVAAAAPVTAAARARVGSIVRTSAAKDTECYYPVSLAVAAAPIALNAEQLICCSIDTWQIAGTGASRRDESANFQSMHERYSGCSVNTSSDGAYRLNEWLNKSIDYYFFHSLLSNHGIYRWPTHQINIEVVLCHLPKEGASRHLPLDSLQFIRDRSHLVLLSAYLHVRYDIK